MIQVLLKIVKKLPTDNNGHYRWYPAFYKKASRIKLGNAPTFYLNNTIIKTEKDLCYLIYTNYGEGEYRVQAWRKGHKGTWTFWIGEINAEGFMFRIRKSDSTKIIDKLKEKLGKISSEEEKELIIEEIEFEKEFKEVANSNTDYGFAPFLKSSGKRGSFIRWTDVNLLAENPLPIEQWNTNQQVTKVNSGEKDDWGILKQTRKQINEDFEKW